MLGISLCLTTIFFSRGWQHCDGISCSWRPHGCRLIIDPGTWGPKLFLRHEHLQASASLKTSVNSTSFFLFCFVFNKLGFFSCCNSCCEHMWSGQQVSRAQSLCKSVSSVCVLVCVWLLCKSRKKRERHNRGYECSRQCWATALLGCFNTWPELNKREFHHILPHYIQSVIWYSSSYLHAAAKLPYMYAYVCNNLVATTSYRYIRMIFVICMYL